MRHEPSHTQSPRKAFLLIAPVYALLSTVFLFLGMAVERLSHDPDPSHLLLSWGAGKPQPLYGTTTYLGPDISNVQAWCQGLGFMLATLVICFAFGKSRTRKIEFAMVLEAYVLYQLLVLIVPIVVPALRERLIDTTFTLEITMMSCIVLPMAFAIRYFFDWWKKREL